VKILITGGNGFIGKSLHKQLSSTYSIIAQNSSELDLLDSEMVFKYLQYHCFDVVIHSATYDAAPKCSIKDPKMVLENNIRMFLNLMRCECYFNKMIYFGSCAEFGRHHWKSKMQESYFDQHVPRDQYGLSKYIMTRHTLTNKKIINLRLFGLFGEYDDWRYRFIPNICCRAMFNLPIVYNQNKSFEFLYIDDLVKIVDWFIQNAHMHQVYNVCPGVSYSFEELTELVLTISGKRLPVEVKEKGFGGECSGDNTLLLNEIKDMEFTNIETAIRKLYAWYEQNKDRIDEKQLNWF